MSAPIMAEVARHSQARGHAQCVLLRLAFYADSEGKNAFPSLQTLANATGCSERHTQRLIRALKNGGHITIDHQREHGHRPRNVYTICRPWRIGEDTPSEQMITDVVSVVQGDHSEQTITDICIDTAQTITDICTNVHGHHVRGSYNPKDKDQERVPAPEDHAHAPEERAKRERLLEVLGCPAGSDAWQACMNGYLVEV